ncbi:hypothetical protein NXS19_010572 [Fusarium pseudograminearum]|nr:hypothetical protein NXS19_010572 [Fusarium pseudograminearum]
MHHLDGQQFHPPPLHLPLQDLSPSPEGGLVASTTLNTPSSTLWEGDKSPPQQQPSSLCHTTQGCCCPSSRGSLTTSSSLKFERWTNGPLTSFLRGCFETSRTSTTSCTCALTLQMIATPTTSTLSSLKFERNTFFINWKFMCDTPTPAPEEVQAFMESLQRGGMTFFGARHIETDGSHVYVCFEVGCGLWSWSWKGHTSLKFERAAVTVLP